MTTHNSSVVLDLTVLRRAEGYTLPEHPPLDAASFERDCESFFQRLRRLGLLSGGTSWLSVVLWISAALLILGAPIVDAADLLISGFAIAGAAVQGASRAEQALVGLG